LDIDEFIKGVEVILRRFKYRVNSSLGLELVIVTFVLAAVLYIREFVRIAKMGHNRIARVLDILLVPLLIVFAVVVILTLIAA
jgi:cytochrome c oxidase subunit IV